ncbi:adenylyl cyclase-associated protein 1 isoform 1-T4 [Glossina fuscipes fuscipes]
MFSCCRVNPKSTKVTKKLKKTEDNAKANAENETKQQQQQGDLSTNKDKKKLIIPTITIENGKALDNNAPAMATSNDAEIFANNELNGNIKQCIDETEKREEELLAETETETETETVTVQPSTIVAKVEEQPTKTEEKTNANVVNAIESNAIQNAFTTSEQQPQQQQEQEQSERPQQLDSITSTSNNNNNSKDETIRTTTSNTISRDSVSDSNTLISQVNATTTATRTATTTATESSDSTNSSTEEEGVNNNSDNLNKTDNIDEKTENKPKSCLSRHNSGHISIKKRVNISTHAEIIEPDPLMPVLLHSASLGDDEDDVFSDSMPPPKRDSMCAPYIERLADDDDLIAESLAYCHGLPEWFNNERINDVGCLEPPVTPVGRDELELKRQRLYEDLLRAAHAAVEHSARFSTFAYNGSSAAPPPPPSKRAGDCDPDLKPSVAENLENLVNRLEKLVERLERSICARELEIANRTFDSVLEKKRESFDLESTELPPVPVENFSITEQTQSLNQRIERIEESLTKINERHSLSSQSASLSLTNNQSNQPANQQKEEGSLENIPTVLEEYQSDSSLPPPPPPLPSVQELESMSVVGYQDIVNGPLSQYLALSYKIGGDVAKQAEFVKLAFEAQLQYVNLATQCSQPGQDKQMALLKPTSDQITAIQDFREKNRASPFFNHLSAISESIPALGWVCVSPTPGPHVKEMNDAGQFYTNRVLKEWKEKDVTHVEWARAWVQTLTELQQYIKQFHTTGLVWSGKGTAVAPPPPPMGACPPPPPPPTFDLSSMSLDGSKDERSALFAEINQGEAITKNLKKVTADMQTHKNPTLRTGPAPFKPTQFGSVSAAGPAAASMVKDPIFTRDGKKWLIEYQKNNPNLLVENAEMNNVVYVFKSEGSTLTVKGKVNNIVMDSCKKCSLLFDSVVASVEFVNCQSVQMQVLGHVPTISIDKTDGCQMYLSKHSLGVEVVSSKSSEMNIMLPEDSGDYTELPLPEQFKTTISGKTLKTVCVDSLG